MSKKNYQNFFNRHLSGSGLVIHTFLKTIFQVPIIGSITGAEYEFIEIDGVRYIKDSAGAKVDEFSSANRGEYLGAVTDGNIIMRVFSVKGDDSGRYIYAL